jgi:hypothetical protein
VDTLQSRYAALCRLAGMPRPVAANRHDRLPFAHRLLLRAIFEIRASRLLPVHRDPVSDETGSRFYGLNTCGSDLAISNQHGTVISGDCLGAVLLVPADFPGSEESAAVLSR